MQQARAGAAAQSLAPRCRPAAQPHRRATQRVRAEPEATGDGVQDLLARDLRRRKSDLPAVSEFDLPPEPVASPAAAAAPAAVATVESDAAAPSSGRRGGGGRLKSRQQRRKDMAASEDATVGRGPKRCKDAIDAGLALFEQKQYQAAIDSFNLALELPGNGAYRLPGSPREYLCPSDAEENAALYNMACCYAQMGQKDAALTCLDAILENGFEDVKTMLSDPDLAPVRGPALQQLIDKYTGVGARVMGLFKKKDTIEADPNESRPWWEVRW